MGIHFWFVLDSSKMAAKILISVLLTIFVVEHQCEKPLPLVDSGYLMWKGDVSGPGAKGKLMGSSFKLADGEFYRESKHLGKSEKVLVVPQVHGGFSKFYLKNNGKCEVK